MVAQNDERPSAHVGARLETDTRRPCLQKRFLNEVIGDIAITRKGPAKRAQVRDHRSQFTFEIRIRERLPLFFLVLRLLAKPFAHGNNPLTGCRPRLMNRSRQSHMCVRILYPLFHGTNVVYP